MRDQLSRVGQELQETVCQLSKKFSVRDNSSGEVLPGSCDPGLSTGDEGTIDCAGLVNI